MSVGLGKFIPTRGGHMGKDTEMLGSKNTVYFLSNKIYSTLQEEYQDSEESRVQTGEDIEVHSQK